MTKPLRQPSDSDRRYVSKPLLRDAARNTVTEKGLRPWEDWKLDPKPPAYPVAVCGATGMKETDQGVCPVHGGDACLISTRRLVDMLKAFVGESA